MYDINLKNVKKGKGFFAIFLIAGIFFLMIMIYVYVSSIITFNSMDSSVMSTGVEVRSYEDDEGTTMYSPVYSYEVDGVSYTCSSSVSSSISPDSGNKIVYYYSKDPAICMTEYTKSSNNTILLFMLIPILFIVVAIVNFVKVNKRIKIILELNQKGKLVKNLPYRLEETGKVVNGVSILRPVVDYVLPNGLIVALRGDDRYDKKTYDKDGMVDLIIDENNPENYFIDFEINRLSGNLPEDYYVAASTNPENNSVQTQSIYNQNTNFNNSYDYNQNKNY